MQQLTSKPLFGKDYIAREIPEGAWIIEPFVPVGGLLLMYGSPKMGKSFVGLQLAAAIAGPEPDWLGFPIALHGPVLYIQADTPPATWQLRCKSFMELGVPGVESVAFADRLILPAFPFNITDSECVGWLRAECARIPYIAVVIDTLREIHSEDEDKSQAMKKIISALVEAVGPVALILVHHDRKPSDRPGSILFDMRGSGYLGGRADCILRIQRHSWQYIGRSTTEDKEITIPMRRVPQGLWARTPADLAEMAQDRALRRVFTDPNLETNHARAKALAEAVPGLSFEAAKKRVQRTSDTIN